MAFMPDRFIRRADPDLFRLKCMFDQQCELGCRTIPINAIISKDIPCGYEDALTFVCYGMTFDELMNRSIFAPPIAARKVVPVRFPIQQKIYRSQVQNTPFFKEVRVLAVPGIHADFYSSPLSCHPKIPTLFSLALGQSVYCLNFRDGPPKKLFDFASALMQPTALKWVNRETLAIGTKSGSFMCYDMTMERLFRKTIIRAAPQVDYHISAMTPRDASGILVGNNVSDLVDIDLRASRPTRMNLNIQTICSLAYREDILLAGGNDNELRVYDTRFMQAAMSLYSFPHKAAVRALSFLPGNHNAIITGGGMADKTVRLYDISKGSLIASVDTGAQVSNLITLRDNTFISTHGIGGSFCTNSVTQWQYQERQNNRRQLLPKKVLGTTPQRVLYADRCADSGGEDSFLTLSADETLRLWKRQQDSKENDDESWLNKQIIR